MQQLSCWVDVAQVRACLLAQVPVGKAVGGASRCLHYVPQAAEAARLGSAAELHDADSRDGDEQLLVQAVGQSNAAPNAVPLQVLEALLQEYPQHQQLMRQQQEGETAAAARQPDTDATGEQGLLPKEVFIRQLIKRACVEIGEKVVIFSESLVVLDSLEQLMQEEFGYKLDRHYLRLQGSTDAQERRRLIRKFNHKQQVKVRYYHPCVVLGLTIWHHCWLQTHACVHKPDHAGQAGVSLPLMLTLLLSSFRCFFSLHWLVVLVSTLWQLDGWCCMIYPGILYTTDR